MSLRKPADQCLAPGGSDEKFITASHAMLKSCPKFMKAKLGSNINFIVDHTIGQIPYNATGFLFKNKDVLRAELVEVIQRSSNPVTAGTFAGVFVEKGKLAKGQLIGSQFLGQLSELMGLINVRNRKSFRFTLFCMISLASSEVHRATFHSLCEAK